MKIIAIMPIKLNNERLQGKNTKLLGGKPLICYELEMLKQISAIEKIYVYCSDVAIKEFLPEGVIYLERPKYLDSKHTNFNQIFDSFKEKIDADIYVYSHATAPFISVETARECIDAVISGEYDSAFCAQKVQDYLWKDGKPLNFDAQNLPRSQDLDIIYRETSGVYVFTKDVYEKLHRRIGQNPYIKAVSYKEAIDINEQDDFELAEKFLC